MILLKYFKTYIHRSRGVGGKSSYYSTSSFNNEPKMHNVIMSCQAVNTRGVPLREVWWPSQYGQPARVDLGVWLTPTRDRDKKEEFWHGWWPRGDLTKGSHTGSWVLISRQVSIQWLQQTLLSWPLGPLRLGASELSTDGQMETGSLTEFTVSISHCG